MPLPLFKILQRLSLTRCGGYIAPVTLFGLISCAQSMVISLTLGLIVFLILWLPTLGLILRISGRRQKNTLVFSFEMVILLYGGKIGHMKGILSCILQSLSPSLLKISASRMILKLKDGTFLFFNRWN